MRLDIGPRFGYNRHIAGGDTGDIYPDSDEKMIQRRPSTRKASAAGWLLMALPVIVYLAHAAVFRRWLIDDAGISFTFSRNLAQGFGLVTQPGLPPIEAYSNFLWVILLAPFFLLHIFEPYITLKALGALFVAAAFALIHHTFRPYFEGAADETPPFGRWAGRLALPLILTLVALNTSFVVWTTSGLENALNVLLATLLLTGLVRVIVRQDARWGLAAGLGLLVAGLGMTRPDGIIYLPAYPAALLIAALMRQPRRLTRSDLRNLLIYAGSFAALYGGFLLFRLAYFGELLPNTYHAKGGPSLRAVFALLTLQPDMIAKTLDLFGGVASRTLAGLALFALVAVTLTLGFARRLRGYHLATLIVLLGAAASYLLLPADGMGEYRFGTNFVLLIYLYGGLVAWEVLAGLRMTARLRGVAAAGLIIVLLTASAQMFAQRSRHFAAYPPIPFADIEAEYGRRYDDYAAALGIPAARASVLLPDLGGTLFNAGIRIYDLGMLGDKTIARTLRRNRPAFYDYVFEEAKPTFIHLHDTWTYWARLEDDPRFRRDYTPVYEYPDPWAMKRHGLTLYSGDYVRKDALNRVNTTAFDQLRAAWQRRGSFNTALYQAIAGDAVAAERIYEEAQNGATRNVLQEAIRDVRAFLLIFPGNSEAAALLKRLESNVSVLPGDQP
jgi:hypothetical protein